MAPQRLRVALVGLGRVASAHLAAIEVLRERVQLVATVSGRPEAARAVAEPHGARAYTQLAQAIADPDVDAVILCTPNAAHAEQSIAALEGGKHVLVEKIMATTVAEADRMVATAERHERTLMVAQCRRFFRAVLEARERLPEIGGAIDVVHVLGVDFREPPTAWWASEEMRHLVLDMNGPHVIDTILWLMGETPCRVYAQGYRNNASWPGIDQATLALAFPSGRTATGHLSFNTAPEVNERLIVGARGTMRLRDDRELWLDGAHAVSEEPGHYLHGGANFVRQLEQLADAIAERREPIASGREVREVVRTIAAARCSLELGAAVALDGDGAAPRPVGVA